MEKVLFTDLPLSSTIQDAIQKKKFEFASEIQAKTIPIILEQKKDILGIAQTGTGKTGAFGLPIIDLISENNKTPKAIILAPTRELALQVTKELQSFTGNKKLSITTVYGGSAITTQIKQLRKGVDIVVGTPGRVKDLMLRNELKLSSIDYFILDEADEMLNMGFIDDIEEILEQASDNKRVYLFSATMPLRIKKLSQKYMKNQQIIEVKKQQQNTSLIEQSFYKCKFSEKFEYLLKLIEVEDFFYGIIFCKTKADVDSITSLLNKNKLKAGCIHGDIPQNKRERVLQDFRNLKLSILVATDVAARGIDVENLSHVINYNLPEDVETYTHRIGRTGRAGNKGKAISLTTVSEMRRISNIERTLKVKIESKKIPSDQEISSIKHKKLIIELDGMLESYTADKHIPLAEQLLTKHNPEKVISALLEKIYGSNKKTQNNSNHQDSSQSYKRIFIAKGRKDNLDKKRLFKYLERETQVKINNSKDVRICDTFSFMTLPYQEAEEIVDFYQQRKGKSLVEFAK
jgi:ATP-dependent RNA helicase DeaD